MDHTGFEVSRSGNPMVTIMEKSEVKIWTNDVFFGISPNFSIYIYICINILGVKGMVSAEPTNGDKRSM